jgi:uncharacterized membrane protein
VTLKKYLVLSCVMLFASAGNVMLARGMKQMGSISFAHLSHLFAALLSPWVVAGIASLIVFMSAYLHALSWADLTFVLPATSFGNIITALLAKLLLHENVTPQRWIGIVLITAGVGFVTSGPANTTASSVDLSPRSEECVFRGPQ